MALVKLHLGCGKRIIPGYVNMDIQARPGVDVVCDLRRLPVPVESVDVVYTCAVIEHFGRWEWKKVLSHWYEVIKAGGTIRVSTADFRAVVNQYLEKGNVEELLGCVVGGQKDDYDRHGMIFDFEILSRGLSEAGFINVRRYDCWEREPAILGIDDYSQAYLPHMDRANGRLMTLNVEAEKPAERQRRGEETA